MIKFTPDTPAWIEDWVKWTCELLVPDWDINVVMVEELDVDTPDDKGEIEPSPEYLRAEVKYEKSLEDTTDGHERVVHEIGHAFLAKMSEAANTLISSKVVKKTAWKNHEYAEEEAVVRLSRILVSLRNSC